MLYTSKKSGFSILQVLVALVLAGILGMGISMMMSQAFKSKAQLDTGMRVSRIETDLATLALSTVQCTCALKGKTIDLSSLTSTTSLALSELSMHRDASCATQAFVLASTDPATSPETRVSAIQLKDIVANGSGKYLGRFAIQPYSPLGKWV